MQPTALQCILALLPCVPCCRLKCHLQPPDLSISAILVASWGSSCCHLDVSILKNISTWTASFPVSSAQGFQSYLVRNSEHQIGHTCGSNLDSQTQLSYKTRLLIIFLITHSLCQFFLEEPQSPRDSTFLKRTWKS